MDHACIPLSPLYSRLPMGASRYFYHQSIIMQHRFCVCKKKDSPKPQHPHALQNVLLLSCTLHSFRHCSTQDLCPEEATLCPLNDLLVHGLRWVVHDDCAGLVVNLCVYACVTDEIDDPLFSLVLGETETGGKVPVWESALCSVGSSKNEEKKTHLMSMRW